VVSDDQNGKRMFSLTEKGVAEAGKSGARETPWEQVAEGVDSTTVDMQQAIFQVVAASMQVAQAGSEDQLQRTMKVLAETRRRIYAILGEDE
jgi:hypothetical protein